MPTLPKNPGKLLRVMVDANTLVSGTAWPRFPYEVLQHSIRGAFRLVLSEEIIAEARYALARIEPSSINVGAFEEFLATTLYELVPAPSDKEIITHHNLVRDPNDVHVALASINAQVDFLLTQDKDFTDHDESTEVLHKLIKVMLPGTFLREHMGWTSEQLEAIRRRMWSDLNR